MTELDNIVIFGMHFAGEIGLEEPHLGYFKRVLHLVNKIDTESRSGDLFYLCELFATATHIAAKLEGVADSLPTYSRIIGEAVAVAHEEWEEGLVAAAGDEA